MSLATTKPLEGSARVRQTRILALRNLAGLSWTTLVAGSGAASVSALMASLGQVDAAVLAFAAGLLGSVPPLLLVLRSREALLAVELPRLWAAGWRPPAGAPGGLGTVWRDAERALGAFDEGRRHFGPYVEAAVGGLKELVRLAERAAGRHAELDAVIAEADADEDALGAGGAERRARDRGRAALLEARRACESDLAAVRTSLLTLRTRIETVVLAEAGDTDLVRTRLAATVSDLHERAAALEVAAEALHARRRPS